MEWLIELLYLVGLFTDIAAWFKSREYRKERKRRKLLRAKQTGSTKPIRSELDEPIKGKEAWQMFLFLTPLLVLLAVLWAWFKGWVVS
jgi:hypothetical protein